MENLEDIIIAIRSTNEMTERSTISCNLVNNSVEISRYLRNCSGCKLFFHSNNDQTVDVYFMIEPWVKFIKNREELIKNEEVVVLSGINVFSYLGIPYEHNHEGLLEDLQDLCIVIQKNREKILEAFSKKKVKRTYSSIISLNGNNEKEINRIRKTVHNLVD